MKVVNKLFSRLISRFSPRIYFQLAYLHHRHKLPNLDDPKDLSELWIRRVLDGTINNIYFLADKYEVRKYVERCGCADILTGLIGVYASGKELVLSELPNRFALKANWGAGMNFICTNKLDCSQDELRFQVDKWLSSPKYTYSERHYNLINRRVVCEEFIDDGNGGFPIDYKFICIKGEILAILVCNGRETGHTDYIPYDINWKPRYDYCFSYHGKNELVSKPKNLDSMIEYVKKLSAGIEMVRVDLYSNGMKIWFGEMTLTPDGCIFRRWTQKAIDEMGEYYRRH